MTLARALIGTVAVLVVPGVLVARLLRLQIATLATWAAVPVLSIASVFLLGEITDLIGVPFGIPAFVALLFVLSAAVLVSLRFEGTRRVAGASTGQQPDPSPTEGVNRRVAYVLLALGLLIGLGTWFRGIQGEPLIPPGGDATRHGFMVGRIEHGDSIDVGKVVVFDADGDHRSADYYPLAMHASAATASRLVGADAGEVLMAFTVLFAAVVLPLGMFVLARLLAPSLPLVAGFTAFVTPSLMLFPYSAFRAGVVPAIVGITMVPISVVLVTRAVLPPGLPAGAAQWLVALLPASLVLLAAVATHTSQLPLIAFLVLLLVLQRAWRERDRQTVLRAVASGAAIALLVVLMLAPTLRDLVEGASERSTILFIEPDPDYRSIVKPILTLETDDPFAPASQVLIGLLAIVGAVIWVVRRQLGWVVAWLSIMTLAFLASISDSWIVQQLTFPWYRIPSRIIWNQTLFVPFFVAVALTFGVMGINRLVHARRVTTVSAVAVVAVAFVVSAGFHAYRVNRSSLHEWLQVNSTLSSQARVDGSVERAFRWLRGHAHANETVVNEANVDGSLWMYPEDDVKPLIGWAPSSLSSFRQKYATNDWRDRMELLAKVGTVGRDPRVARLARKYNAKWIFFDEREFLLTRHVLQLDALRQNEHISEVFHQGPVHVFRINRS